MSKRKVRAGGGDDVILVESRQPASERGRERARREVALCCHASSAIRSLVCRVCGSAEHGDVNGVGGGGGGGVGVGVDCIGGTQRRKCKATRVRKRARGRGRWSVNFYLTKFFPPFRFFSYWECR